jgi:hypothetical protein
MITRDQLEDFFISTRTSAQWSIDAECCWDYFFVDSDREKLVRAGELLEQERFELVGLLEPSPDDDDQETVFLQVRRVERHTVDTLHALNSKLYAFAETQGLRAYDGMDVSPVGRAV